MKSQIAILGTLNAILGGAGTLAAIALLDWFATHGDGPAAAHGPVATVAFGAMGSIFDAIVSVLGQTIGLILLIPSILALVGGIGLLRRARWSRVFMIVVSLLQLLFIPIGTLLGSYGIWCLTRPRTKEFFPPVRTQL